jgi:hypothetical protein
VRILQTSDLPSTAFTDYFHETITDTKKAHRAAFIFYSIVISQQAATIRH